MDVLPRIEYKQFQLVEDQKALDLPADWARQVAGGRIAVPGGAGLLLATGGNDFYPAVRVEVRGVEPPGEDALWEVVESAEIRTESGVLRVRTWDGGIVGEGLSVAPGRCRVRVHCRGRAEAAALIGQELYYEGVEEWLLRVWPLPERSGAGLS
ncbi:hypothetical protein ACFXCZ_09055 [Streptomyces sp. NPDC059396]|uniref:hypothetical protein n=1 Tax=Streptomyces sp. NPDC059396 TaxID=3346819 RepID=UPI0036BAB68D